MNITYAGNNRAADFVAQDASFIPKLWKKGVEVSERAENFFEEFEGTSASSPIRKETDTAKGQGQKIVFRQMADLYGDGVIGDEAVGDNAEQFRVGTSELEVDWLRHAVEHTLRTEDQTALEAELKAGIPTALGRWLGRKKTERLMMMFNSKGGSDNYIFSNNRANREALKTADTITKDLITSAGEQLKTRGARAALVGKSGQNRLNRFILVAVGEGLVALRNSAAYLQALQYAGIRGADNVIFKGGYVDVDGHIVREFVPVDHDGYGAIGSAMNPKAVLGVAITAGSSAVDITAGGSATAAALLKPKYFEFFSNYAYRFTPADILTAGTTERYCLIYNVTGADAGKVGFYAFTTNNGNKLTMTKRLGSTTAGDSYTTVGAVVWNTGAFLNKCTDAHPAGSIVIETNSYGVPFGRSYMLGADAARRGYGRFTNMRTEEKLDGEFIKRTYINSIFGQAPTKRADGKMPNFLVIEHALAYQGLALPTIA
ncbi:MAG: DUF4043 family protein [Verrucomicrobiia bacterium]